jgi:hypothetical protein
MRARERATTWTSTLTGAWGALGVAAILLEAAARLGAHAMRAIEAGLTRSQWVALVVGAVVMLYAEGYRVFQRREARSIVARARWLARRSPGALAWAAPLYALSLICGDARRCRRAWMVALGIVASVIVVRTLHDPWRGVVDGAIAPALLWGAACIGVRYASAMRRRPRLTTSNARY